MNETKSESKNDELKKNPIIQEQFKSTKKVTFLVKTNPIKIDLMEC